MRVNAAVAYPGREGFVLEDVELAGPGPGDVVEGGGGHRAAP